MPLRPRETQKRKLSISFSFSESGGEGAIVEVGPRPKKKLPKGLQRPPKRKRQKVAPSLCENNEEESEGEVSSSFRRPSKQAKSNSKQPVRALSKQMDWDKMASRLKNVGENKFSLPPDIIALLHECRDINNGEPVRPGVLCPLLAKFDLTWEASLQCIRSRLLDGRLLPGDYLLNFLKDNTKRFQNATKNNVLRTVIYHLALCYPTIKTQVSGTFWKLLPTALEVPLSQDFLRSTVMERYRCPYVGCEAVVAKSSGTNGRNSVKPTDDLKKHMQTHDDNNKITSQELLKVPLQATQLIKIGPGKRLSTEDESMKYIHYFDVPASSLPGNPMALPKLSKDLMRHDPIAPSTDTWQKDLGWTDFLTEYADPKGTVTRSWAARFQDLLALPSKDRAATLNGHERLLELGLLRSNKLNVEYLDDGATWASRAPLSMKDHFSPRQVAVNHSFSERFLTQTDTGTTPSNHLKTDMVITNIGQL